MIDEVWDTSKLNSKLKNTSSGANGETVGVLATDGEGRADGKGDDAGMRIKEGLMVGLLEVGETPQPFNGQPRKESGKAVKLESVTRQFSDVSPANAWEVIKVTPGNTAILNPEQSEEGDYL